MDERTWKSLKEKRKQSNLSWNLFLLKLIEKHGNKQRHIK
jgi:hypothetical protein